MKRIAILLMLILIVFSACSKNEPEAVNTEAVASGEEFTGTLILGIQGGDRPSGLTLDGKIIAEEDRNDSLMYWRDIVLHGFPYKVEIRNYASDSTTIKMDADIAGGDAPDVYWDYLGRVNKFANSKYALPINLTFEELDDYLSSALDPVIKDGKLYALPGTAWASVMVVNKDLVESVGMGSLISDVSWTIDEFLMVVSAVQEKYGSEYYGFPLFAAGTGGDYWSSFGWLASFGAKLYENGKIVINSKEGIEALEFMKFMSDSGIAVPGAAGLGYKVSLAAMGSNNIVACGNSSTSARMPVDLLDGTGTIDSIIMEWPKAPGVDKVPVAVGPDAGMVFASTKHPVEAMELLRYINSTSYQRFFVKANIRFASRKSVGNIVVDDPTWGIATDIINRNGTFDIGVGLEKYSEVRNLFPPMLQAIFTEELTVQEAVDRFVEEGSKVINE